MMEPSPRVRVSAPVREFHCHSHIPRTLLRSLLKRTRTGNLFPTSLSKTTVVESPGILQG